MNYSGTLKTNAYNGRYLLLSWWVSAQYPADNATEIYWKLTGAGESTEGVGYYKTGLIGLELNGESVYMSSSKINLYDGTFVADGHFTVNHFETEELHAYLECGIYSNLINCTGESTWELPELKRMAIIDNVEPFTDEENLSFYYSVPDTSVLTGLEARLSLGNATITRAVPIYGSSFTITFNDTERESLRANCTDAKTELATLYLESFFDGDSATDSNSVSFTVVNAEPTLNADILDTNSTTNTLTGSQRKMIKGFNTLTYAQIAQGNKGATIKEYSLTYGGKVITDAHGTIPNAEVNVFVFSATDSRGYTATKTVTLELVDYIKPTCNQTVEARLSDGVDAEVSLTIKGNYFNASFGSQTNELILQVRHTDNEGNDGEWVTLTDGLIPTFSGNTYSLDVTISGFKYDRAYTFQSRAIDKVTQAESAQYVVKLQPVFDWSKEDFNFNVPVNINGGRVYGVYTLSDTTTDGIVELNDSISNYDYIEILFTDNNGRGCGVAKFIPPVADNSHTIDLFLVEASSNTNTYIRRTAYICKGTTLTPNVSTANYSQIWSGGGSTNTNTAGTNYIKVVRVLGYK